MAFRKLALAAALAAGVAAAPAPASASVKIGVLTCQAGPSIGLIIGSSKRVSCTFAPDGGRRETYYGRIGKLGLDIGVTGKSVIVWAVFAAQSGYRPGSLAGTYGGVSAEASVLLGVGANALIGGSNKSIALQPLSVQAQVGLNIAAGVTSLTLSRR